MRTFRTLFSGGELFGVGACAAGWQHLDGYEIDPSIAAVARLNGFDVRVADVCDVDYESLPPVDHLHVSPSCKRASRANTRAGEAPEDLASACAVVRAIEAHHGTSLTLENVIEYRFFESYDRICQALVDAGFRFRVVPKSGSPPAGRIWHDAGEFVDAADFGVPQNRRRLILRAVRGRDRVPGLRPTHGKRGGVLLERWRGWLSAIEDILDTLPDTVPAPWQIARMPKELRETLLIGPGGYDGTVVSSHAEAPSFTVTNGGNSAQWRAFLLQGRNAGQEWGKGYREGDEPSPSITTSDGRPSHDPIAYLVGGGNTGWETVSSHARPGDAPAFTVSASDGAKKTAAAFLLDGSNGRPSHGRPQIVDADDPAYTIGANKAVQRAYVGRWVRMTVQALGRFQTVPDDYIGLTPEINGNGIPCLLAQRMMESLL